MTWTPDAIGRFLDGHMHRMDGPAQWIGSEPNAVAKDWDATAVRVLLAASWPYEQAAGNQSIPAVWNSVNYHERFLCDRFYLPATPRDMRMFERDGVPVFGVEHRRPAGDYDVLGTSISYTILLMNFVRYLAMSGIPLRWRDRVPEEHPMVIIGGQAYCNPEVMAPVADCVFLGEAEDEPGNGGIGQVLRMIEMFKAEGSWATDRVACYARLARTFNCLYFPRFVSVGYRELCDAAGDYGKRVSGYHATLDGVRVPFLKRHVVSLDSIRPLDAPPLLFTDPSMGSGDVEAGRGCVAWCSFPLTGSEEIITDQGLRRIDSAVGETVSVWTGESNGWRKATVEAHGCQRVQAITFVPATRSGLGSAETCKYGHVRVGIAQEGLRATGRSLSTSATGKGGQCATCRRVNARNSYYMSTGRPEKVTHLVPVPGWKRDRAGWRKSSRTSVTYQVTATPTHGWELVDGTETHDLRVGDYVAASAVTRVDESSREFKRGWIHGMMFGDGSKLGGAHVTGYKIRLFGEKDLRHLWRFQEMLDWTFAEDGMFATRIGYEHHPVSPDGEPSVYLRSHVLLKEYPRESATPAYLAGFVEGWMAADSSGRSDDTGVRRLYSQRRDARAWLDRHAALAGWLLVGHAESDKPTNFGPRSAPMNSFTLARPTDKRGWKVTAIEQADVPQDVFCLTVPGVRRFTLAQGVMTGNCRLSYSQKPYRQHSTTYTVEHAKRIRDNLGGTEVSPFAPDWPLATNKNAVLKAVLENVSDKIDTVAQRIDDFISDDTYLLLQSAGGARSVTLGLEGVSQRMRDLVGKATSDQDVREAVTRGIRAGFKKFKLFMIVGLPGEDTGDVARIMALARDIADIRDSLAAEHVLIQFSFTPLLYEAQTPFQWFSCWPTPDHDLIDVAAELRELKIQMKIGAKAETNRVHFFQLCQRASRDAGEAVIDVLEELGTGCWGGVPKAMKAMLNIALQAHGFAGGMGELFGERGRGDLLGWEFIDTGISRELLWDIHARMREFALRTDSATYDSEFDDRYHGNEWADRCDERCMGNSCGVCSREDLRLRQGYVAAAPLDRSAALRSVRRVDQSTVAVRVRARIERPEEFRWADNEFRRHLVRRAGYRAQSALGGPCVAKRSIWFASDAHGYRDWSCGTDYVEFGLTQRVQVAGDGAEWLARFTAELRPWIVVAGCEQFPAGVSLRATAGLSYHALELRDSLDRARAWVTSWRERDYVPLLLRQDGAYFTAGAEEVNGKDLVEDLWLARNGTAVELRMLSRRRAGPYQVWQALTGRASWIEAAAFPARTRAVFAKLSLDEGGVACVLCGSPIPESLGGGLFHEDYCPRCADEAAGVVLA